jgi:hypothetical protein
MPPKNDPTPAILRIEELVRRVKEGDIKLPKFQRPFVWNGDDILNLWDSVYRGYPIGSLLLWRTKERLAATRNIGDLNVDDRPDDIPTNYLLDGQQRLSTLCGVLYWPGGDLDSLWNVAFNLRTQEFFYPRTPLSDHEYPLNRLLETFDFISQCERLRHLPDKDSLELNARRLLSSVKDYKIATVVLGEMSLDEVAPIFERINSTGRQLTIVDLMCAATWSGEFDLSDVIEDTRAVLRPKGFHGVDDKQILRNLASAAGFAITSAGIEKLRDCSTKQLRAFVESIRASYARAVDFLTEELGVPSLDFLPYAFQLTLLTEYFRICPTPTATQRKSLRAWFWRTSLSGYYKGANTTVMAESLDVIRKAAENELHDLGPKINIDTDGVLFSEFGLNRAISKAFALLLAANNPRSLLDGAPIKVREQLAVANRAEFHHIFPKAYLKNRALTHKDADKQANICLINLGGNRKILSSPPSAYLSGVAASLGNELSEVLRSNYISDAAWQYLLIDDYDGFLLERMQMLSRKIHQLTTA